MSDFKYRTVNQAVGMQPRLGPIAADQAVPWLLISLVIYLLTRELFQLDLLWTVLLIIWGCGTWWLLTGSHSHKFLGKFIPSPTWTRGRVETRSLLEFLSEQEAQVILAQKIRQQKARQRKNKKRKSG